MAAIEKEKALDVVRQMVADGQVSQEVAEKYFPELKSEDERIRKELIEQVVYIVPNEDEVDSEGNVLPTYQKRIDKYLAWIEKQGEHANFRSKIQIGDKVTRNDSGVLVNLSQLERVAKAEKQDEQKPADNIEPKFKIGDYIERKDGLGCHAKVIFIGKNVYGCEKLIYPKDSSPFFEPMFKNQDEFKISSDFQQKPAEDVEPKFKIE